MGSLAFEAIELPSEANPLNPQTLFDTLTRASSSDPQQVKTSTQQLQNWEKQPGFYSSLQLVFIDTSLPFEVRYLCAIQLKNGIDKYWRKTASNAISKDERALIRSRCIESGISEPDRRLALQNALVVAKITRLEFPHDWPDAFTTITQHLRDAAQSGSNSIYIPRILLILLNMVKELSSARLQRSRLSLQSATPDIFQTLGKVYVEKSQGWMGFIKNGGDDEGGAISNVEHGLLALRILRRLVVAGYEHPNRNKEVQEFWRILSSHFGDMFALTRQHGHALQDDVRSYIERHLVQISKLHLEMMRQHSAAFVQLPDSIGLARAYWGLLTTFGQSFGSHTAVIPQHNDLNGNIGDEGTPYMETISLKALLLLRACVRLLYSPAKTFKYQHERDKVEKKQAFEVMKNELLTEPFVQEMMETLVTRFFVFRPQDLREWQEEPGEWERREEGEDDVWEFSIRSCAEKLFLDLVINNKDLLIQPLLTVFYNVAKPENTDILLKDSIYAAIGLSAPVLDQHLDFGKFLETTLVPEIQIQQPGYNILRRRIAIVLGQWIVVVEGLNRPLIYQIFQYLLDKNDKLNDEVVRITAGRQLKNVIEPFEFTPEPFTPFASAMLVGLMELIQEVDLSETKLALLETLNTTLVKLEHHVIPFADQIISLLPLLWSQAGDEFLMKQSILGLLSSLIGAMRRDSARYHSLILPLIQSSIEPTSETRLYLLEDALDLWLTVLAQTSESSAAILALTHCLFPLFESATDGLRKAFDITESYFILAPQAILNDSRPFLTSFTALLPNLKREANGVVMHLVGVLIQTADILGGASAIETLTEVLIETGFFSQIVTGLKTSYDAHQTTGPNRVHSEIDGTVETDYLSILARLAVSNPSAFISALGTTILARNSSFEETVEWLLVEWFSHFENIGNPIIKKLHCLALTSLLNLGPHKWILAHLQDLMTVWTDVVLECVEVPEEGGEGKDTLIYQNPEELASETDSPEEIRKRAILFADPIHRINIKDFIRQHLQHAIVSSGGQDVFQNDWVLNVDQDVVRSFGALAVL